MKQKVAIRLQMDDEKKRRKAMKLVARLAGLSSASIEGPQKDRMVVVGEGLDSVALTRLLRKNMGFAELISVATMRKDEEEERRSGSTPAVGWSAYGGGGAAYPTPVQYYYVNQPRDGYTEDPSCCTM
ncbi:hypothetical protein Taro_041797 [Colocasia esculenta]|uniref:Uncharacterized protein n=1 Tax=Colocasia esculenta TaxID=4460 RepID=A0A843WWV0_COLES|nr:hypothetical protein [Colocasia esculenta]